MSERTDNLSIEIIKDKQQFINDLISKKVDMELGTILSVDVVNRIVNSIGQIDTSEVLTQVHGNQYLWIIKKHN
jgi:predicted DNA-binding protein